MNISTNLILFIMFVNIINSEIMRLKLNSLKHVILSNEFIKFRKIYKQSKKYLLTKYLDLYQNTIYKINEKCVDYYSLSEDERHLIEFISNLIC